jgi:hypothetical protein
MLAPLAKKSAPRRAAFSLALSRASLVCASRAHGLLLDNPVALVDRLVATARGDAPIRDDIDRALEDLLRGEEPPSS